MFTLYLILADLTRCNQLALPTKVEKTFIYIINFWLCKSETMKEHLLHQMTLFAWAHNSLANTCKKLKTFMLHISMCIFFLYTEYLPNGYSFFWFSIFSSCVSVWEKVKTHSLLPNILRFTFQSPFSCLLCICYLFSFGHNLFDIWDHQLVFNV